LIVKFIMFFDEIFVKINFQKANHCDALKCENDSAKKEWQIGEIADGGQFRNWVQMADQIFQNNGHGGQINYIGNQSQWGQHF
jgi:hypothetical protein